MACPTPRSLGKSSGSQGTHFLKAGRLIEAKAEPVPGAIEPKATSIG